MATGRFAEYFNHSDTADVHVAIEVVKSDESNARRELQLQGTLPETASAALRAHEVILMANSPVWKAHLQSWQGTGEPKRIIMIVEAGEKTAAYILVQCLYTASLPDIETEADLRLTLGILMLADQYQVEAALELCAQKLERLTDLGTISWELADRVMQLPAGYLEKPGLPYLLVKIQEKILQHVAAKPTLPGVGLDLEVVMANAALKKGLMALPLRKCASLLSDNQCRVASENTVAAVVVQHVELERLRVGDGDGDRVQTAKLRGQIMAEVIRVPHLSSLFATGLPTLATLLTMNPETYAFGRELAGLPADFREKLASVSEIPGGVPGCWLAEPRAPSTVTALGFDWEASCAELAAEFDPGKGLLAYSPLQFFAGMRWAVTLNAGTVPGSEGRAVDLKVHCISPLFKKYAQWHPWGAMVSVSILAADKKSSRLTVRGLRSSMTDECGWKNLFDILPMQKWDESRMQKWTDPNGFLTLRVKVSNVM